jgi:ubiquinone/menaquinone biosynthesis C-methylase UbiE
MLRAINDNPDEPLTYGADSAEASDNWFTALSNAAGQSFCEGMVMLDYGCGCGRYANWISRRIKDFTYYGLEPERATP